MEAPKEKILKYNDMKKWDVCLMNPPYGSNGGDILHLMFVEQCINICKNIICVMPFSLINKQTSKNPEYRKKFDNFLIQAEELNSKEYFIDTEQENIGIFVFTGEGRKNRDINISYINGQNDIKQSLDGDVFTEYEHGFLQYLKTTNFNKFMWLGYASHMKEYCKSKHISNIEDAKKQRFLDYSNKLPDNKVYMSLSSICPPNVHTYMIGKTGKIFTSKHEVYKYFIENNTSSGYNFMIFDSVKAAENCKYVLNNPLMLYILSRLHIDRNVTIKHSYKFIPDIDWSNEKVLTDEGLLEVCGCPKDKCKEYAEYCRKYMEEFDKQHQSKKKKVK